MAENSKIDYSIDGFDNILGKLTSINTELRFKGGRYALRKAAQIIQQKAQENARGLDDPETAELIAQNVAVRFSPKTFKATGDLMFRVGVLGGARATLSDKARRKSQRRRERLGQTSLDDLGEIAGAGKDNPGGDTWYWRLLEYGTEDQPATPFMRPAAQASAQAVFNEFFNQLNKSIDRAIKQSQKTTG